MNRGAIAVLDASAVLAMMHREKGQEQVLRIMESGSTLLSSVNLAEVAGKQADKGISVEPLVSYLGITGVIIVPFDHEFALEVGHMQLEGRALGLSLGDRACLALARREGLPAVTGDRAWLENGFGVEVIAIR